MENCETKQKEEMNREKKNGGGGNYKGYLKCENYFLDGSEEGNTGGGEAEMEALYERGAEIWRERRVQGSEDLVRSPCQVARSGVKSPIQGL